MKNKTFRKIIILAMTLIMLINTVPASAAEVDVDNVGFSDVKDSAWYASSVRYVAEKGIMVGTSTGKFSPNTEFTRSMTVQVLSRLSGDDLSGYTNTDFPDVPEGKWFTTAVAWAADKGVAQGDGTNFNPDAVVTREQLARMIHQFSLKYEVVNNYAAGPRNTDSFVDADKISDWAKEDMAWVVYNGIISGKGNNNLDPKGTATRAEAAKIFYFLDYMITDGTIPPDTADFDELSFIESDSVRFLCWGDSMTHGYPGIFRKLTRISTLNYSAGGDTAEHIAMKQGGMPMYAAPFTIPASGEPVKVLLLDENYEEIVSMADLGGNGLTPVLIGGVKGALYYRSEGDCYYFERQDSKPYSDIKIDRLTRVVTKAMTDIRTADIHVIFSGPSNGYTSDEAYKLIETQKRMIDYVGHDNYIIISLTSEYYLNGVSNFNEDLAEYYGDRFLDFRTYIMTEGFEAAGIEPTEQDLIDLANDEIPSSFRSDEEHGNEIFDTLLAQQVYLKAVELGYIEDLGLEF